MSTLKQLGYAAALSMALQAHAAEPVTYWAAHAGTHTLDEMRARVDFGAGTPIEGQADLKRGIHGGVMVGRRSEHARYELEYEAGSFKVEHLTLGPVSQSANGRGRYQALFANAYRVDRLAESLDGFLGAGIGWGRVKLPRLGLGSNCDCFGPASKNGLAWQLRAGLAYRLSEQDNVSLQYTWLGLPRPESDAAPSIQYERTRFGALTLGYSRQF